MSNWLRDIETAIAGTTLDRDILEDLAQHAESTYEALRADGVSGPEASQRIAALIAGWRAAPHALRRIITRAPAVEQAVHDKYDWYFEMCAPARRAFYVFAKHGDEQSIARLCDRIRARQSRVLVEFRAQIARDAASRGSTC